MVHLDWSDGAPSLWRDEGDSIVPPAGIALIKQLSQCNVKLRCERSLFGKFSMSKHVY